MIWLEHIWCAISLAFVLVSYCTGGIAFRGKPLEPFWMRKP